MPLTIQPNAPGLSAAITPPADVAPPDDAVTDPGLADTDALTAKMPADADQEFDPQSNPVVQMITSGDMSGIVGAPAQFKGIPQLASLVANPRAMLSKTGLGFYPTKDKRLAIFNPEVIKPNEIKDLDAKGKLDLMLTPVDKLFGGPAGGSKMPSDAPGGGGLYDSMVGGPSGAAGPSPASAQAIPSAGPLSPPANPATLQTRMRASTMPSLPAPRTPSPTGGGIYNRVIQRPV